MIFFWNLNLVVMLCMNELGKAPSHNLLEGLLVWTGSSKVLAVTTSFELLQLKIVLLRSQASHHLTM
jgi:hypothetical protein